MDLPALRLQVEADHGASPHTLLEVRTTLVSWHTLQVRSAQPKGWTYSVVWISLRPSKPKTRVRILVRPLYLNTTILALAFDLYFAAASASSNDSMAMTLVLFLSTKTGN